MLTFQKSHIRDGFSAYYPSFEMTTKVRNIVKIFIENIINYIINSNSINNEYYLIPNIIIVNTWNTIKNETSNYKYAFPNELDFEKSSKIFIKDVTNIKNKYFPYLIDSNEISSKESFINDIKSFEENLNRYILHTDLIIKRENTAWWCEKD